MIIDYEKAKKKLYNKICGICRKPVYKYEKFEMVDNKYYHQECIKHIPFIR